MGRACPYPRTFLGASHQAVSSYVKEGLSLGGYLPAVSSADGVGASDDELGVSTLLGVVDRRRPAAEPAAASRVCGDCGAAMVLRTAKRGPNAGGEFWGCSRWPACTSKQPQDRSDTPDTASGHTPPRPGASSAAGSRRRQPGRVAAVRSGLSLPFGTTRDAVSGCTRTLLRLVYETVAQARLRSLREMWLSASDAAANGGDTIRRRVLRPT